MAKRERKKKVDSGEGTASGTSTPDAGKPAENATPAPESGKVVTHDTPTVNVSSPVLNAAEAIPSLHGVPITPLHSKETDLIARLGELDFSALRDMALERRWQAEVIQTGLEIKNWSEYEWFEQLTAQMLMDEVPDGAQKARIASELARRLEEANALENESNMRIPMYAPSVEEPGERKPTPAERADTIIGGLVPAAAPMARAKAEAAEPVGEKPVGTETAKVETPARNEIITAIIAPEEDFSIYGDIFYTVDRVFLEAGEKSEPGKPEEFGKRIEKAIELAEKIASKSAEVGAADEGSPEMERVRKLRNFRKEFFEIEEGKELPQKEFDGYRLWLEKKRMDFEEEAGGAFEALGILPGEYDRKAIVRICDSALRGDRPLDSSQQEPVLKLMRMLEAKKPEGDVDEAAAERNADVMYGLVVGFAENAKKGLDKARVAEIQRLETQVKEKKFEIAAYEDRQGRLLQVLTRMHALNRRSEETTGEVTRQVREQLQDIETTYEERKKLTHAMFGMLAGDGQAGAELMNKADEAALAQLGVKRPAFDTGRRESEEAAQKKRGQGLKGINLTVAAAAGAVVFAAGLFASQYFGGNKAENEAEKPAIVQVEKTVQETAEGPSAKVVPIHAEKKIAAVPDAGAEAAFAGDAGVGEVLASGNYSRDKEGLKKALDDWCKEEHGLLVDGEMLRASYAAIEGQLDGSVLPTDAEWVSLMLERKFPNRLVELAIMSDVARSELGPDEKYAALMRLSIPLGDRARLTKSFITIVEEANAIGIALPRIDENSHLGKIEGAKTGRACLAAAYFGSVADMMDEVKKGALESGLDRRQFKKEVREALGEDAKELEKAYERAKFAVYTEKKTPGCKMLSGGKTGFDALSRAYQLSKKWIKRVERDRRRQAEVDDILGSAPPKVKTTIKHGKGAAASPCTGLQGIDYLSCASKQNVERGQAKDTGEKKMHAPKGKESGTVSKSPKMLMH